MTPHLFTPHMKRVLRAAGTSKQNRTQFSNVYIYIYRRRGNTQGLRKAGENRSTQMKVNTILLERPARAIASSNDTITVGARLDASCAKQFARAVARLAEKRTRFVIIDMAQTKAVDSSGFGALIAGFRKLAEYGAAAVVVCANPTVRKLFDFAGVAKMIAIVDRMKEARRLSLAQADDALAS